MFCDLVGSTPLAERLDPEEFHQIIHAYQESVSRAIARYEGHVAQYLGDGLLVYFGYPNAHEDDAERAVCAGLELVAEVERLNGHIGPGVEARLAVRTGIHSGPIVVGTTGGSDDGQMQILGHTMNLSARLQSVSKPNTVTVSAATARLLQGSFVLEDIGAFSLTGIAEPVVAFRVIGRRAAADRLDESDPTSSTCFVGRERELALLADRWQQVRAGHGQVELISGEPGIGKSRMIQAFGQRLAGERHLWFACRCSPYLSSSAFAPVVQLIEHELGFVRGDLLDERISKIERAVDRLNLPRADFMPVFLALLSLPGSERYPMIAITPEAQRRKTLAVLIQWLLALSEVCPIALVVEDLHWIDPSTLELLGLLLEGVATAPVLLLLTFRPHFEVPWALRSHMERLSLRPLAENEMMDVIASLTAGKTLPPAVLAQVITRADGVPLFAEEIVKNLIESGQLEERADSYALGDDGVEVSIPSTLQDSLMARLDRLGAAKDVAQLAAVAGRMFSHELLEAICERSPESLATAIEKLVETELLYRRGIAPRATYTFKHVLIQDAAYRSLLNVTRREYHRRIADVLASRLGELGGAPPEITADHYTRAGANEHALHYWTMAAQHAAARAAHSEVLAHLSRASKLLATLPATPGRSEREIGLLLLQGGAISATRGLADPAVEDIYGRALRLSEQVADNVQVLIGLWSFYLLRADLRRACALAEQLVELAERQQIGCAIVASERCLGATLFYMGRVDEAHRRLVQARTRHDPAHAEASIQMYGQESGVTCTTYAAMSSWMLGHADEATRLNQEAVDTARRIGHPYSLAVALVLGACQAQFARHVGTARALAEECFALSNERGFALWSALSNIVRGWAIAFEDDPGQGIQIMQGTLESYVRTGAILGLPYFQAMLSDAIIHLQPATDASRTLDAALEGIEATGERWIAPEIHRLRGELLVRQRALAEAEACFRLALETARAQGARAWELRAMVSLGRLLASSGRVDEARAPFAQLSLHASHDLDTVDGVETRELLAALT